MTPPSAGCNQWEYTSLQIIAAVPAKSDVDPMTFRKSVDTTTPALHCRMDTILLEGAVEIFGARQHEPIIQETLF